MASPAIHRAIPSGRGGLHAGRIAELAEEVRRMSGDPEGLSEALAMPKHKDATSAVARHLEKHGGQDFRPLGSGRDSIVFDAGERVAKIGFGPPRVDDLPGGIRGVLPYEDASAFGPFRVEFQKKAEQPFAAAASASGVKQDMALLRDLLGRQGWVWKDNAARNMGYMNGRPVVIDGKIVPMPYGRIIGGGLDAPLWEYPDGAIPSPFVAPRDWPVEFYQDIPRARQQ